MALQAGPEVQEQLEAMSSSIEKIDLLNQHARLLSDREPQQGLAYSQQAYELAQLPPPYRAWPLQQFAQLGHLQFAFGQC